MLTRQRQRLIAQRVANQGGASVQDLAARFGVSAETIRRDLGALEGAGLVERTHGGAVAATGHAERSLEARSKELLEAKSEIARLAVGYLPAAGGSILLDAGSTTAQLVRLIPPRLLSGPAALTIFTDSAPIAAQLATAGATQLHILGGHVRGATGAVVGAEAVRTLSRLRVDVTFLGLNGLHPQRGLTTADPSEATIKRAMAESGRTTVALADATKYAGDYAVSFADLTEIDVLVSDVRPTGPLAAALDSADVEVVLP